MKIALTHQSAARLYSSQAPSTQGMSISTALLDTRPLHIPEDLAGLSALPPEVLARPVHLMVANRDMRVHARGYRFHYSALPLPPDSFALIGSSIFCVRPELCFAQMSSEYSRVELIRFGCELCSTYIPNTSRDGVADIFPSELMARDAITTTEQLKAQSLAFGVGNARAIAYALRWVVDNSASPRETALYLLLCLPYRLGGYNLPKPVLNCKIPLNPDESKMANRGSFRADLYWPDQRLDVEYDSTQYHLNEARMETDAIRRNVLSHKGIRVVSVTRNQINNVVAFDGVARQIGKVLGKRIQPDPKTFYERRKALRSTLLGRC